MNLNTISLPTKARPTKQDEKLCIYTLDDPKQGSLTVLGEDILTDNTKCLWEIKIKHFFFLS
jgi:hypothetical protein